MQAIAALDRRINDLVKGKRVRIIREWHDQPYGRSKPNLEGKEFVVKGLWIDGHRTSVRCEGLGCAPDFEDVEFLN